MQVELSELEQGIDEIRRSPATDGKVELIVRRPEVDQRETVTEARLDTTDGLVGDGWRVRGGDKRAQVTVMNSRAVALLAQTADRWALAGDQLYVDLDLSPANLPPGSLIEIGEAVLEVSDKPHRGCKKFAARFGLDALRFVNSEVGYSLNLRGINTTVVRSGTVRAGDIARKL
jgi:MOSC domain-containing protein YiiM